MSNLVQLTPGISRREVLRRIAFGLTATAGIGVLSPIDAQHVHQAASEEKKAGPYKPKVFNTEEYKTLHRLAELIVPADAVSGSGVDAGAPEFIDILCSENGTLTSIFTGGLGWLDAHTRSMHGVHFVEASEAQQIALLEQLVAAIEYRRDQFDRGYTYLNSEYEDFRGYGVFPDTPLGAGARFFEWARRLVVDAFYTSPLGVKDVGYVGNKAYSKYTVPQEAIDFVNRIQTEKA